MLTLLSIALLQSQVWIVDDAGGPGVDFTDLPQAVAAASQGDVLILRSGNYSGVLLDRGITIHADQGATVLVAGLRIESVAAGEHVHVAGLTVPSFLWIADCDGKVWIEDCRFEPPGASSSLDVEAGVNVHGSADVVLLDTVGTGRGFALGTTALSGASPTPGLWTTLSSVHVVESTFEGGQGAWLDNPFGGPAIDIDPAPGGLHESGELFALASTFVGGQGHGGVDPWTSGCVPAPGAAGLTALAPAYLRATDLVGGPGGWGGLFGACPGADGPASSGLAPTQLQGEYVALEVPSPVRENGTFDLTLDGSPGVLAVVGIAATQDALLLPPWGGSLLIQGPYVVLPPVTIPPAGTVTQTFPLLDLGPSVQSLSYYGQAAAVGAGAFTVNDASAIVLLDASF